MTGALATTCLLGACSGGIVYKLHPSTDVHALQWGGSIVWMLLRCCVP